MIVNSSLTASACERGNHLRGANESPTYKVRGSSVGAVLDQQSKDDREQDEEEKPSFHEGECDTGFRQVNSGSQVGLFSEMRRSGRELATGAFEANGNHFDQ
jgi:hypothetical protein